MAQQVKSQVQTLSNRLFTLGGTHRAGQHSLTDGEIVCAAIAGIMIFAPSMWAKMPLVGKYGSAMIAFAIMVIAFIIW